MPRLITPTPVFQAYDPYWANVVCCMPLNEPVIANTYAQKFRDFAGYLTWAPFNTATNFYNTNGPFSGVNSLFVDNAIQNTASGIISGVAGSSSDPLNFAGQNFVIELLFYPTSVPITGTNYIRLIAHDCTGFAAASRGWNLLIASNQTPAGAFQFISYIGSTSYSVVSSAAATVNTWTYLAIVRSGSNLMMFRGGLGGTATLDATTSISGSINNAGVPLCIGACPASLWGTYAGVGAGYYSNVRITVGTDRGYTSSFPVPGGPFPTQ
jgi:Concanavalin A-like lectin/glucanases superfamily